MSRDFSHVDARQKVALCPEHVSEGSCPVGLPYRPKPHLRQDKSFNADLRRVCQQAEQDLRILKLVIKQQEKNANSDTQASNRS